MNELFGISTSLVTRDMPGTTLNAPREVEPKFRGAGMTRSAESRVSDFWAGIPTQPEWMRDGMCAQVDPELFFPDKSGAREAKLICRGCPVQELCLQYALDNKEHWGIWGGTSERERQKIRRDMREAS